VCWRLAIDFGGSPCYDIILRLLIVRTLALVPLERPCSCLMPEVFVGKKKSLEINKKALFVWNWVRERDKQ
jgi:hypothetical protein